MHPAEDAPPGSRGIGWPADGGKHALFPRHSARYLRPAADADDRGLDRGPDVDVRVANDEDVVGNHLRRDATLLRTVDQVVDEHAQTAAAPFCELGRYRREVVDAVEEFHDHSDIAQVVAPDLLD